MSQLQLYTNPQSRGRVAHWMMEELGLPYETVWLEYGTTMKAPDYLAVNPMGKVPALKHRGSVITEAAAICAYVADAFPDQGLRPAPGTPESAAYHRWLFFAAGPLEQAVVARSLGWAVPEGRASMVGFGSYEDTLNALELALSAAPYVCGEHFSAADVYVRSSVSWGLQFGTIEKRPVFEAYAHRLQIRPAAIRAHALNEARLADPG
jgi:glutathione S-transferase